MLTERDKDGRAKTAAPTAAGRLLRAAHCSVQRVYDMHAGARRDRN